MFRTMEKLAAKCSTAGIIAVFPPPLHRHPSRACAHMKALRVSSREPAFPHTRGGRSALVLVLSTLATPEWLHLAKGGPFLRMEHSAFSLLSPPPPFSLQRRTFFPTLIAVAQTRLALSLVFLRAYHTIRYVRRAGGPEGRAVDNEVLRVRLPPRGHDQGPRRGPQGRLSHRWVGWLDRRSAKSRDGLGARRSGLSSILCVVFSKYEEDFVLGEKVSSKRPF